jgi:hypothetical protein
VQSAAEGQKVWAAMTAMERSRILRRAVEILRERNDELAPGNPGHRQGAGRNRVDIVTGADVLEYYAGLATAIEGISCRCAIELRLHPPRAAGRGAGIGAELPDPDRHVESAGPGGRQRDGVQAERSHPLTA